MKLFRSFIFSSSFALSVLAFTLFPGAVQAVMAPYYAYGDIYTRTGSPDYSLIEQNSAEDTGPLNVEGGWQWWCETPNCGISIVAGASTAWGEVSVDPSNGSLGARAGSLGYSAWGGYGRAYGYISQVFRVGTDGTLQPGDSVSVDAAMSLQGVIENQSWSGSVGGLILVNHYGSSPQYHDYLGNTVDYMPVSTFEDVLFTPEYLDQMLGAIRFTQQSPSGAVSYQESTGMNVSVGDVLVMESMLYVHNDLGYSADLGISWTDFLNTMDSALTTTTPGATLNAVPVPLSLLLFASGLPLLLIRRKKQP